MSLLQSSLLKNSRLLRIPGMRMRAHLTLQLGILSPLLFLMQTACSSLASSLAAARSHERNDDSVQQAVTDGSASYDGLPTAAASPVGVAHDHSSQLQSSDWSL